MVASGWTLLKISWEWGREETPSSIWEEEDLFSGGSCHHLSTRIHWQKSLITGSRIAYIPSFFFFFFWLCVHVHFLSPPLLNGMQTVIVVTGLSSPGGWNSPKYSIDAMHQVKSVSSYFLAPSAANSLIDRHLWAWTKNWFLQRKKLDFLATK